MAAQTNTTASNYFDLHTSGLGYMNRLRLVRPDKSRGQKFSPFWAVSISAITGDGDDVKYVNYDVTIKGEQAKEALNVLKPFLIDDKGQPVKTNKVLVGFRIGDALPDIYMVKGKDPGTEEPRVCMKGRLLKLTSAKVNGEVIDLPKTEHDEAKAAAAESSSPEQGEGQ